MIIEKKKISDLIPAPYNPRQSTAKQEKHLKESLEKFGLVEPIIFNKQTGYIVGGHFRVRELKKLGINEIECVIVDLNEADEKELNIRLNANTGSWDWDTLANDWDVVDLEAWGLDIPQFDTVEELEASEEKEEINVIELKFYNKDYKIVKEKLNNISMSPEIAVLKLLGVE
jgi:ParB-like chromosome segregation protein Spo0J